MVYTSGQIALDPSGKAIEGSVADKTHACIKSLEAILKASGSSISQVVKVRSTIIAHVEIDSLDQTTVFITSSDDFGTVNDVYAQYFTHKPARSCVVVKALPMGFPVEIEAVAVAA